MKAVIKPRNEMENRILLQDKIPLSTPMIIEVDSCNLCNFKCEFCPCNNSEYMNSSNIKRGCMSLSLFERVITDIEEFDEPIKVMRFHKQGEPLLNKELPKMIKMAKQSKKILFTDFTTNASLLEPNLIDELIEAKLDKIVISIESLSEEGYKQITGTAIKYDRLMSNIKLLYESKTNCEVCIKIGDIAIKNLEDEKLFYDRFGDICDRIFIDKIADVWPEYTINNLQSQAGVYGNEISTKLVCPYIFYTMAINPDGTVNPCCVDWKNRLIMGDINKESLKSIWQGKKYREIQMQHLRGEKNNLHMCRSCGLLTYATVDNIDEYRDEILKRIYTFKYGE